MIDKFELSAIPAVTLIQRSRYIMRRTSARLFSSTKNIADSTEAKGSDS